MTLDVQGVTVTHAWSRHARSVKRQSSSVLHSTQTPRAVSQTRPAAEHSREETQLEGTWVSGHPATRTAKDEKASAPLSLFWENAE